MKKQSALQNLGDLGEIRNLLTGLDLEFLAREVVEGFITGLHRSPFHGFSVEFAEHRLYNQGESTRHIDWKLFARTEKLFVKRYEEETNLRSQMVIDVSSSMLFPTEAEPILTKLGFAVVSAAALIHLLQRQRDAVGLTLFSEGIELNTQAKMSPVHVKYLYHELTRLLENARSGLNKGTNASQTLHQIAENLHQRSLVILFSDMLQTEDPEELFGALRHLRHNKHEVVLFHISDKKAEQDFDFRNRPYRFIDLETNEEVKFNPNDIRASYQEQMRAFFNSLKLRCGQYRIDLVEADIQQDFSRVLLPYLIKRGKLY